MSDIETLAVKYALVIGAMTFVIGLVVGYVFL